MLMTGCGHSFVRPVGDLGGSPDEFAGLLYKTSWQKQKVLPVVKNVRIEARVVTDQGERVIEGQLVGGSVAQSALLVDLGAGAPSAIPVSALKRMKVHDTRFRDSGMLVAGAAGAAYGSLIGLVSGAVLSFSGSNGFLIGFLPPAIIGTAAGLGVGFLGAKSYYIVDFTTDTWEWELPDQ
jgi:hypothetical protein